MAGRVPAIHVFAGHAKDVDGRHTGGHDENATEGQYCIEYSTGAQPDKSGLDPGMTSKSGLRGQMQPDRRPL